MGSLHAIQALLILVLANAFALPVTALFITGPPGTAPEPPTTLFEIPTAWAVAAFFVLSALAHFLVAAPGINGWYVGNLRHGRNYARWIEYSLSASLMIVLIAGSPASPMWPRCIAAFGVNASMILFGLAQEMSTSPAAPWLPVRVRAASPGRPLGRHRGLPARHRAERTPPTFVYRDLRVAVRALQLLRRSCSGAVPAGGRWPQLPLGRAHLHRAQPGGQDGAGLAGLLGHPGPLRRLHPRRRSAVRVERSVVGVGGIDVQDG